MRIDSSSTYTEMIGGSGKGESAGAAATQTATATLPEDTATFSAGSLDVATLTSQALAMASAMESRVDALRQAVSLGEYTPDPAQIASAMLSEGV